MAKIKRKSSGDVKITMNEQQFSIVMAVLSHVRLSIYNPVTTEVCGLLNDLSESKVGRELSDEICDIADRVGYWHDSNGEWCIEIQHENVGL